MKTVEILGMGVGNAPLFPSYEKIIQRADILAGGKQPLDRVMLSDAQRLLISSPLDPVIERIRVAAEEGKKVVVLADGDPGFFGIGRLLTEKLGRNHVRIHPNVTVLQAAASRLGICWQDIKTVSLHGRKDLSSLFCALAFFDRVAVYTDPDNTPGRIGSEMHMRRVDAFRMYVFENIGLENERMTIHIPEQAAYAKFSPLNFLLLERVRPVEVSPRIGMGDDCYLHERGQITKSEVRVAGLAALSISPGHVVWDLGAGSGSVAIEASLLARCGRVIAVEKKQERVDLIHENIRRTGCYHVEVVYGEMPDCLSGLPEPDRIFIGGGTGRNSRIVKESSKRLKPGGKIVMHLVLLDSLYRSLKFFSTEGWPCTVSQIWISRAKELGGDLHMKAFNPVFIVSADKPRVS